ncbi:MAG: sporulation transcriptional regulator SpoIIID [Bacilli bacterium]|nr:sporulation transcriptional regulator SpoIIID [Bacilli bacterium]
MADNLHDDFVERDRRIEIVGDLFLSEEEYSTRQISTIISNNSLYGFKISNATVSDYIQRYKNKHPEKVEEIDSLIEAKKAKSLKDINVKKRVLTAANLVLNGYSIESIATKLGETVWTIYRDVNTRLRQFDPDLYLSVKTALEMHSRNHNTR